MRARILLVDDDIQALESTRKILELASYDVQTAPDGQAALEAVRAAQAQSLRFDLVLSDVRMPRLGGLEFLRALSLCGETVPVILMTAFGRVEDAVWAMKLGAVDFLTKPFKRQTLLLAVESTLKRAGRAAAPAGVTGANPPTSAEALALSSSRTLIGDSAPMQNLRAMISQVAPTTATILLSGESGSGKELVARQLHHESARARGRFIAINVAAVPEQLIESELFGFEKGAFTGAAQAREGLFEAAHHGTLLLDEIGDMPFTLQAKLLRTLQEGEVRRLGSTASRKIDVRVIAATHRDLHELVRSGRFRQDLLFRLEVIALRVPALRERPEDIGELAHFFLHAASERHGKSVQSISREALGILEAHLWPGNVRELSNVIERAVVFAAQAEIQAADLPAHLTAFAAANPPSSHQKIEVRLGTPLREVEELLIRKTLEATSGDKNMTAKLLGINSRTIYRKLDPKREDSSN